MFIEVKRVYNKFKIVKVDSKYCDYLRQFDNKVPYNAFSKELRPFLGILFIVNDVEYFVPLSSPKEKHKTLKNTLDLLKIDNGNLGVINFNNMIPVKNDNYTDYDLSLQNKNKSELQRNILLRKQLRWITKQHKSVMDKSYILYKLYKKNKLHKNIKNRCCNFPLLEKKCSEYNENVLQKTEVSM
mgnify:CR=1 FL=1